MTARVHSFESLGCLDGEGVRTVIFFAGCPMLCQYCHNVDTVDIFAGKEMSAEEITQKVLRNKPYFGERGGVTYSGGEPLSQAEFLQELTPMLKSHGISVTLDTAGSIFAPKVLEQCDLVILDIKHADPKGFYQLTHYPMDNTLKTLRYLQQHKKRFWVRQVIVQGYTQDAAQVRALKALAEGAEKIELLPYHTMGVHKWEQVGRAYPLKDTLPPTADIMQQFNQIIKG